MEVSGECGQHWPKFVAAFDHIVNLSVVDGIAIKPHGGTRSSRRIAMRSIQTVVKEVVTFPAKLQPSSDADKAAIEL
jgi:hypothetical protein